MRRGAPARHPAPARPCPRLRAGGVAPGWTAASRRSRPRRRAPPPPPPAAAAAPPARAAAAAPPPPPRGDGEADADGGWPPLEGRFSFKQLRLLPNERLKGELRARGEPTLGRRPQLAGRLYQRLVAEGRALSAAESAVVDADLPSDADDSGDDDGGSDGGGRGLSRAARLARAQRSPTGRALSDANGEDVMSNVAGLQLLFLVPPGGSAPCGMRVPTALAARTLRSVWFFECGEDTQRALLGHPLIDWKRVDRFFISSCSADAALGLPGMLCTVSASRAKGHEAADVPVHVYGPPGLVRLVSTALAVSRTYLEMPVVVHELVARPTAGAGDLGAGPGGYEQPAPAEVLKRSKIFGVPVPPDQLNPGGYWDAELAPMLSRATARRSGGGADARAGLLPAALPPAGDPAAAVPVADMSWTLRLDDEFTVTALPLRGPAPCFGYVVDESARSGKLFVERAVALGVPPGADFTTLKLGGSVVTPAGRVVRPEEVVGPPRRGRRFAVAPPCAGSEVLARRAGAVDVLVHALAAPGGAAGAGAGAAAAPGAAVAAAAAAARALRPRELVLWQPLVGWLDGADAGDAEFPPALLAAAADAAGDGVAVSLAGSFLVHEWEREEPAEPEVDVTAAAAEVAAAAGGAAAAAGAPEPARAAAQEGGDGELSWW